MCNLQGPMPRSARLFSAKSFLKIFPFPFQVQAFQLMANDTAKMILETCVLGTVYIVVSACLIFFNKYMNATRFPFAKALTTGHMLVATLLSQLLYRVAPSLFPTMPLAKANWRNVLKSMLPLGVLFAIALYCSNKAYHYLSVAFTQFCKEGNVALMYGMACVVGVQAFSWRKAREKLQETPTI